MLIQRPRRERWRTKIGPLIAANLEAQLSTIDLQVEYAMLIDAETAGKGLLKERADLRAMLGAELTTGVASCNATMLFLITRWKEVGLVSTTQILSHVLNTRWTVILRQRSTHEHDSAAAAHAKRNASGVRKCSLSVPTRTSLYAPFL
jgi:hypothetical protein